MTRQTMQVPLRDLRYQDLRSSYLLLGECCELGQSPEAWLGRLHEGLAHLAGVQLCILVEGDEDMIRVRRRSGPEDAVISCGWQEGKSNHDAEIFMRLVDQLDDPCWPNWTRIGGNHVTRRRDEMAGDRDWYGCETYNTFYCMSESDDLVMSRVALRSGRHLGLQLWRRRRDGRFSDRQSQLFHLISGEISALAGQGRLLTPGALAHDPLSPRLREVLRLIGTGLTEKEVAEALALSPHTVHDYVKQLHRELDVTTRGELVAAALRLLGAG